MTCLRNQCAELGNASTTMVCINRTALGRVNGMCARRFRSGFRVRSHTAGTNISRHIRATTGFSTRKIGMSRGLGKVQKGVLDAFDLYGGKAHVSALIEHIWGVEYYSSDLTKLASV